MFTMTLRLQFEHELVEKNDEVDVKITQIWSYHISVRRGKLRKISKIEREKQVYFFISFSRMFIIKLDFYILKCLTKCLLNFHVVAYLICAENKHTCFIK